MRKLHLYVVVLTALTCFSACSSSKKTVTTEERVEHSGGPITESDVSGERVAYSDHEHTTVTKSVEEKETPAPGCSGILGCTVEVIGDIIALPFRAVAGLIRFIF